MKFTELARSLKEGIKPIYLFEGEEAYFRDHAVKAVQGACALSQPMLNDVRVEGETLKGEKLSSFASDLYTLPFFDAYRIVRVYGFSPTEKEWESVLAPYAKAPCETTVLLIVNEGKKANCADLKRKAGVCYVDCGREDEETLSKWLAGVSRRKGVSFDGDAASLAIRYCASDAARLQRETEKLALLLGEGGRITRSVVEENVAKDVEYKIYELTQAASQRNYNSFCEILHDLMEKGFDEYAALSSLSSHYRTLYEVGAMKGSDAEVSKALGIKPYAVKKNREAAARLGRERTAELYQALFSLSSGAKSGEYTKTGALAAAVAKIFFD